MISAKEATKIGRENNRKDLIAKVKDDKDAFKRAISELDQKIRDSSRGTEPFQLKYRRYNDVRKVNQPKILAFLETKGFEIKWEKSPEADEYRWEKNWFGKDRRVYFKTTYPVIIWGGGKVK